VRSIDKATEGRGRTISLSAIVLTGRRGATAIFGAGGSSGFRLRRDFTIGGAGGGGSAAGKLGTRAEFEATGFTAIAGDPLAATGRSTGFDSIEVGLLTLVILPPVPTDNPGRRSPECASGAGRGNSPASIRRQTSARSESQAWRPGIGQARRLNGQRAGCDRVGLTTAGSATAGAIRNSI
jgi:hypothetical protein